MSPALGCIRRARVREIKLFAAIETNLVSPAFDGEDPAQVAMTTAESELEHPTQRVHPSYNRAWRGEGGLNHHLLTAVGKHSLMKRHSADEYPTMARNGLVNSEQITVHKGVRVAV